LEKEAEKIIGRKRGEIKRLINFDPEKNTIRKLKSLINSRKSKEINEYGK